MKKKALKQIRTLQAEYINELVEKITSLEAMNGRREWYRNEFKRMADEAIAEATGSIPMGMSFERSES